MTADVTSRTVVTLILLLVVVVIQCAAQASCGPEEFQCSQNGRCIPTDRVCNNFNDCLGGTDEQECLQTQDPACRNLTNFVGGITTDCFNSVDVYPLPNLATSAMWTFDVPLQDQSSYLISINIAYGQLLETGNGLPGGPGNAAAFATEFVTSSGQSISFISDVNQGSSVGQSGLSYPLEPNDMINMTVKYTPDVLNEPFQLIPYDSSQCLTCFKLQVVYNKYPECMGQSYLQCMRWYYLFDEIEAMNPQCVYPAENSVEFRRLYSPCLDKTSVNVDGSLTVLGCPEDITAIAAPGASQIPINWEVPIAFDLEGNLAGTEGDPSPGSLFAVGQTQLAEYVFFGSQNKQDECRFNVTITRASCDGNFFTCGTGECIPSDYVCDSFQDCSDGSDRALFLSDELNPCEITGDQCKDVDTSARNSLVTNCLNVQELSPNIQSNSPPNPNNPNPMVVPWNFTNYAYIPTVSSYLLTIILEPQSISSLYGFVQPSNPSGRFSIALQTTKSRLTEELYYVISTPGGGEASGNGPIEARVEIRVPLLLQHLDSILLNITYTPDFLNNAPRFPINPNIDCPNCVRLEVGQEGRPCGQYLEFTSVTSCLIGYYLWDKAGQQMPQCEIEERAGVLRSLPVGQCLETVKIDDYDSVLVLECPDSFNTLVPLHGGAIYWSEPTFINATDYNTLQVARSRSPGADFGPGNHVVSYTLIGTEAVCVFNIIVAAVQCSDNYFGCSNGRCIPEENHCDYFDDCGDGSDETLCVPQEVCDELRTSFNEAIHTECPLPEPPSLEYIFDEGSGFYYESSYQRGEDYMYTTGEVDNLLVYKVPLDQKDLLLEAVSIDEYAFEILGNDYFEEIAREQYAFKLEVSTSRSNHIATTFKFPQKGEQQFQGPSAGQGYFRTPLSLRRGEYVHVEVFFTGDYLNKDFRPFPASMPGYSPLFITVQSFRPKCAGEFNAADNNQCLAKISEWQTALQEASNETIEACIRPGELEVYGNLYEECLSAPLVEFVEPDQYGAPGSYVNLRCVASGAPVPSVKWIRTSDNTVISNSTVGSLGVTVSIPSGTEIYKCEIENFLGKFAPEVTVGRFDAQCEENIINRANSYNGFSTCSVQTEKTHMFQPQSKKLRSFLNSLPQNGYWHAVTLLGDSLRAADIQFPPIQTVDLFIRKSVPSRRRKRAIDTVPIYFKRYNHVFFTPGNGNVTFNLEPPISPQDLNADFEIEIVFTDAQVDLVSLMQQEGSIESVSHHTTCPVPGIPSPPQPDNPDVRRKRQEPDNCAMLYGSLSEIDATANMLECGISDNRYKVLQLCLGEAIAAPIVEMHPRSKATSLSQSTRVSCYIENAVRYEWRKISSDIRNIELESVNRNTLWFRQFAATDQGAYECVGFGGGAYSAMEVKSRPAVLTAEGVSTFLVTVRIPDPMYEAGEVAGRENQQDPADWFASKLQILENGAGFTGAETRGYKAGSLIVESLIYYDTSNPNINETELAAELETFLNDEITQANNGESPFDLYGLGVIDVNSLNVENIGSCPGGITQEGEGRVLTWPDTPINEMADSVEKCESYSAQAGQPRATRKCTGDFTSVPHWEEKVVNSCFEGEDPNDQLNILVDTEVTMDNVGTVAQDVADLTNDTDEINGDGLVDISILLENIAGVGDSSDEVSINFVKTVDNVLDIEEKQFIETLSFNVSSRIVRSLERQVTNLQRNGRNFTEIRRNIGIQSIQLPKNSIALQTGITFVSKIPTDAPPEDGSFYSKPELSEDDTAIIYGGDFGFAPAFGFDQVEASIELPSEVFSYMQTVSDNMIPVSFFIYQNSKLFQSRVLMDAYVETDGEIISRRVFGSRIIAATLEGADVRGLGPGSPVVTSFQIQEDVLNEDEAIEKETCGFWDFNMNNGAGDWSTEGCVRAPSKGKDRVVCHCDHLTSFAVVVDIHGQSISSLVLDLISKIGCAVSMAALLFTIITYLAVRNLRRAQPQRILISLCVALFCLYLVFLVGIEATGGIGCIIVAILLHYFTLASLMWMGVEAVNMYMLFVRVWDSHIHLFLVKASIVAWGAPAIVVAVAAGMDYTNYDNENHCFLKVGNVFYFGQLLLIGLILLFNSVVFIIVQYKLTCGRAIHSGSNDDKKKEIIKRLQNAIIISILLGLTWISAFLMIIQEANFVFQVIFCALNSLQGLFIFLLFCVRQTEVRKAWKRWFCCRKDNYRKSSGPVSSSAGGTHSTGTGTGTRGYSSEGNSIAMDSQYQPANT